MELDPYQAAAATTREARVLVSAVPGSGKTRTLVARFQFMTTEMQILPSEVVMITFTRYAAKEMRERIGRTGNAFLGTFHSFALNIIKMYGHTRQWEPEWLTILDEEEAGIDQLDILRQLGYVSRTGNWVRFRKGDWDRYVERLVSGRDQGDGVSEETLKCIERAWRCFVDRLRSENVLTYGLLILEALALLDDPEVLAAVRHRYRHVLVDEAQDSDANQWRLIRTLDPQSLFVVGDVDQSIFEWRGASPALFREYARSAARFDLPNSYRFGFNIADPANKLIRNNLDRLDTAINAISENQGTVKVVHGAQYAEISTMVKRELDEGADPSDIAVLARRHSTLDNVAAMLRADEVPNKKVGGGEAIPATSEFRVIRGYLRIGVNEHDRRAFMAVAASEHLTTDDLWEIRKAALDKRLTLYAAFRETHKRDPLPATLDTLETHLAEMDPSNNYGPALGYMREVMIEEGCANTAELVQCLAMEGMQDQLRTVKNEVTVCTIHAAKGLEWPLVFLVGMNASEFPSPRSVREGRGEEERRLCYVAMTRAEEGLIIVDHAEESESQFIGEMGKDGAR